MPPLQRTCSLTGRKFVVSDLEQRLREKFGAPLPDIHPDERQRYLMAFRNLYTLYPDTCDLCGKGTLSVWGENPTFPVYCRSCWFSDKWAPLEQNVDLERPFFEQLRELVDKSPHPANVVNEPVENSDFCNAATGIKNCYMSFDIGFCEDAYYVLSGSNLKNCVDTMLSDDSEYLYGCVSCNTCFQVRWSEFCENCSDGLFLYDCVDCHNCAFSTGLRHKSYYFFNQRLSKEEYEKKIAGLKTGSYKELQKYLADYQKLKGDYPKRYLIGSHNENVSGNMIFHSKDVENGFHVRESENCSNVFRIWKTQDALDMMTFGFGAEQIYSCVSVGLGVSHLQFCASCVENCNNLTYCLGLISDCHDCFGSVFARKMEYTILNKKYSPEEYKNLRDTLIEKMRERGEFGRMFTPELVMFAYNETIAQLNMPLTKEEALSLGYRWADKVIPKVSPDKIYSPSDDIADVKWEDVEGKVLICEKSQRPYKIIRQELDFYKKYNIPLPRLHPEVRMQQQYPRELFFNLHEAQCSNCGTHVTTSIPKSNTLLCENCYREKVI